MKIKFKFALAFLIVSFTSFSQAASIGFSQSSLTVNKGDIFSLDIVGIDIAELAGGEIDLVYDNTIFEIDSVVIDSYWDFLPDGGSKVGSGSWTFIGFDTFVNPAASGDFTIATINMMALAPGTGNLNFDFTFFASTAVEIVPVLGSVSINVSAVPVPAAIWLMLSGIVGLSVVSRRNR